MNKIEKLILENIVSEKRRKPETNPHVSISDLYKKYSGDKNVFISFVENMGVVDESDIKQSKIGINPRSKYDTPNGIYTYPLHRVFDDFIYDGGVKVPFAGDRPFVYFLKPIGNHIEDINNMNISRAKEYIDKLVRYFVELIDSDQIDSHYLKQNVVSVASRYARVKNTGGEFWAVIRGFSAIYKLVKDFEKLGLKQDREIDRDDIGDVMNNIRLGETKLNYSSNVFNLLFSKVCGIDSICDLGGGIIHRNEPLQCVFFNTRAFEVVDVHENRVKNEDNFYEIFPEFKHLSKDEAMKHVIKSPEHSKEFASRIKHKRFKQGERAISEDPIVAKSYSNLLTDKELLDFITKYDLHKKDDLKYDWVRKKFESLQKYGTYNQI